MAGELRRLWLDRQARVGTDGLTGFGPIRADPEWLIERYGHLLCAR